MKRLNRTLARVICMAIASIAFAAQAIAQVDPGSTVAFGPQAVGTASAEVIVARIRYFSGSTNTVAVTVSGQGFQRGPSSTCPAFQNFLTRDCILTVVFSPTSVGLKQGLVTATYQLCFNCPTSETWFLQGTGVAPSPPTAPSGLVATALSPSRIALRWVDNSTNESGFHVERAANASGPFTRVFSTGANVSSYDDSNLAQLTPYYYRVQAFGAGGTSGYSAVAFTTTPSRCDVNGDLRFSVADVQSIVNQALQVAPWTSDINGDGSVNVVDVQLTVRAVLGLGCAAN